MKMLEILLPKTISDRSLSGKDVRKIDNLQTRINGYVDKIMNPNTSPAAKDFLKIRLKADYDEFRGLVGSLHRIAEESETYEVYDRKTNEKCSGPYKDIKRARLARDKADLKYGAVRYGVRPVKTLKEAVHKVPLSDKDFEFLKEMMDRPIPAIIAPIFIQGVIIDDDFSAQLASIEENEPNRDVRSLIVEWIDRVMPDQMYRFRDEFRVPEKQKGLLSPIHGYDPQQYKGTSDAITGDAYGRR